MQVVIVAAGSRGDVQPYVGLANAFAHAGHAVRFAVPDSFVPWVTQVAPAVEISPIEMDFDRIMAEQMGQNVMNSGRNPLKLLANMRDLAAQQAGQSLDAAIAATQGADVAVFHAPVAILGGSIARYCGVPDVTASPVPLLPTTRHPSVLSPVQNNLGSWLNRISSQALNRLVWWLFGPSVNSINQRLGLPQQSYVQYAQQLKATPYLVGVSPAVYPRPDDWLPNAHLTGYWFLDEAAWQAPQHLIDFIEAGPAPVYIGFGSMTGYDASETTGIVLDALAETGHRAIMLRGWGGLQPGDVTDNICVIDEAPHAWLFPRMRGIVHHGGAGTTAASLRAGRPTQVVSYIADQPFWGQQVFWAGVGPQPIPRQKLTVARLAAGIDRLMYDEPMQQRADQLGQRIRQEDGAANAVRFVEHYVAGLG